MQITRFEVNMIAENCYLLWDDDTRETAIIDCGAFYPEEQRAISDCIVQHDLKLTHLLNTHAHFDHLFGVQYIYDTYGVEVELGIGDKETYQHAAEQTKAFLRVDYPLHLPPVARYLSAGDEVQVGSITLQVIVTPGHTPGGVCYYCAEEGVLFSGDSLFRHAIGRCDFPGGNQTSLVASLRQNVLTLPPQVKVLPGHGEMTTIAEEKQMNPYLL